MQMIVADARGDTKQTNGAADVTGVWSVSGPKVTLTGDISGGAPVCHQRFWLGHQHAVRLLQAADECSAA
jgi:hypothetical protein